MPSRVGRPKFRISPMGLPTVKSLVMEGSPSFSSGGRRPPAIPHYYSQRPPSWIELFFTIFGEFHPTICFGRQSCRMGTAAGEYSGPGSVCPSAAGGLPHAAQPVFIFRLSGGECSFPHLLKAAEERVSSPARAKGFLSFCRARPPGRAVLNRREETL